MPERPQDLINTDRARRASKQRDAALGKHTMSRPWQAYNQMQTMQGQANPNLDRLKDVRRDWNRNLKYTPAGMAAAGASTPQEAMSNFRRTTEDFRQTNRPAYNRMYPLSGLAMEYPEKGGIAGMFLKEALGGLRQNISDIGKKGYEGITSALSGDSEDEQDDYVAKTFGFYPSDVHPGIQDDSEFTAPIEFTDLDPIITPSSEIKVTDLDPDLPFHSKRAMFPRDETEDEIIYDPGEFSVPGPGKERYEDYIDRGLEEMPEPLPFDDSVREAGIASLYDQGPQWGETNRRYEGEYRDHIERTGDRMTYEEFERAWERIHPGQPHKGLR